MTDLVEAELLKGRSASGSPASCSRRTATTRDKGRLQIAEPAVEATG